MEQRPNDPTSGIGAPLHALKPHLRGWIHAGIFPLAVAAGVVLVALAPTGRARIGASVFALSAVLLFGTSAIYHRGNWSPTVQRVLKWLDHSNIFLIIAGTHTPFALLLLSPGKGRMLLTIVWASAVAGVIFRAFWPNVPRWLSTPVYVALGWIAVVYLPDFLDAGGVALLVLVIVGGALYTLGSLVYALKRPNPSPRWFGFHEIFHALTVAAFVVHYIAASMAVLRVAA